MTRKAAYWILLGALTQMTVVGCGGDDDDDSTAKGGSSAHGGSASTSGGNATTSGGKTGVGGGANGGTTSTSGGKTAAGGTENAGAGGEENYGGAAGSGNASHGGSPSGGTSSAGGSHSGGNTASGGLTGSAGAGGEENYGGTAGNGGEENYGGEAGSGGAGGAASTTVTFAEVTSLLQAHCAGCHQASNPNFDFATTAGLYGRLTTALPTGNPCAGKTLVVPNDVAGSFIVDKTSATPSCGPRMPYMCSTTGAPRACLTDEQEALLTHWIEQGAPNSAP